MNANAPITDLKIVAAGPLAIVSEIDLSTAVPGAAQAPIALPDLSSEVVQRDLLLPWQRRKVIQFIEEHLTETIKIEDLAILAKLSKTYFSRVFKSAYNESPYNYVLRRRMELAKALITETDGPLSEIALDCGISDQAHLCKTFRKVFGMTPNNWRRRSQVVRASVKRFPSTVRTEMGSTGVN
ncbi:MULTISPECIES: helix-turn-helix domain-containing protein [unclassified Rhizobium]|uniref:helix-turn-helix domain-containing protein n=1 Tax=unclassified Rhizobium TaxID=2613769 RepID=UPI001ADC3607|nr:MULTISPECIES: AraC family transcriptional regulator [unclassified Rhizobium]MBO9127767.1 helix-turn-helix transcriptional regulator [Rhizobium sp. 16-488-2b]MBO9178229.1 helix-turn-helix transcriptional regulator [Rhizobium sp. 16-488-2a]